MNDQPPETEFDTAEVIELRQKQDEIEPTSEIHSEERETLRREWVRKLYANAGIAKPSPDQTSTVRTNRLASVVLGLPASGKSRVVVEPIRVRNDAILIDADEAKELIPEYENGRLAGRVHQESSDIADSLFEQCMIQGHNMVLALVGKNPERVLGIVQALVAAGYEVDVHLVEVSLAEACRRAVRRLEQTGRFVDPFYVLGIGDNPLRTFDMLKQEGLVSNASRWSNDVAEGQDPVRLE